MKAIETEYNGHRFRSRLEARWAVFFDACGFKYQYEPQGFKLKNGQYYLPDFRLSGFGSYGRIHCPVWAEVKGEMTDEDREKIEAFADMEEVTEKLTEEQKEMFSWAGLNIETKTRTKIGNQIIVLGDIPPEKELPDLDGYSTRLNGLEFSYYLIDGDPYPVWPGIGKDKKPDFFDHNEAYERDGFQDNELTIRAYRCARTARFEHGEAPTLQDVQNYMKTGRWKS